MTLPPAAAPATGKATSVDPFGLWQLPAVADELSFAVPAQGAPDLAPQAPTAVWTLDLTSGPGAQLANEQAIERLAGQVRAIQSGLDAAAPRAEAFLSSRARAQEVAFSTGEPNNLPRLSMPEAELAQFLAAIDPPAVDGISYGLPDLSSIDWQALYRRLSDLFDSVNRQLLHFAWVDTTLDGRLFARTTVNWGGDFTAAWQTGLSSDLQAAHSRSLVLALEARLASLRAILTVSQIAGQIALAVTTPLGPLQAMSLAWQFVSTVISQLETSQTGT